MFINGQSQSRRYAYRYSVSARQSGSYPKSELTCIRTADDPNCSENNPQDRHSRVQLYVIQCTDCQSCSRALKYIGKPLLVVQLHGTAHRVLKLVMAMVTLNVVMWIAATATPLYKTPGAPIEDRIHDLLNRMNLEEKANQLVIPFGAKFPADYIKAGYNTSGLGGTYPLRGVLISCVRITATIFAFFKIHVLV